MPDNLDSLMLAIDAQLSDNPGVKLRALARHLGVDRHKIEKTVRMQKKLAFRDYKKRKKLEHALALLEVENLRIKEIAARIGCSPNAFSRFIRINTGLSPIGIRNQKGLHASHI